MKAADIPAEKFFVPFGNNAGGPFIRTIPLGSQIGITDGAASLTTGFPPLNFTPVAAGGVPPFGQDMNGILFEATSWDRWFSAGGPIMFDSAFSASIGGYPKGAFLASTSFGRFWLSSIDDNTNDPDSVATGWVAMQLGVPHSFTVFKTAGAISFTVPAGVTRIYCERWGAGGGGFTGDNPSSTAGSGGGGGAYCADWLNVTPGQVLGGTVGGHQSAPGDGRDSGFGGLPLAGGGAGAVNIGVPGGGGTPLSGTPADGRIGGGGQHGTIGAVGIGGLPGKGGDGAGGGGQGGTNDLAAAQPGGGGAGGTSVGGLGQDGADGMVKISW